MGRAGLRWMLPLLALVADVWCWQKWDFSETKTTDAAGVLNIGPGKRRGHSMALLSTYPCPTADDAEVNGEACFQCQEKHGGRSRYANLNGEGCEEQKIILFGGRGEDMRREHNPKTYRIEEVNGTLDFATYQTKPVREQSASEGGDGKVPSALYFNDVWQYDLDCHRWADYSCNSTQEQWVPLDPGAVNGGCRIVMGEEICTTPSERFLHGAATFKDNTMLIYGGFSHRCEDYCDDMWMFNFRDNSWTEVDKMGRLLPSNRVPFGPGKRTKFAIAGNGLTMVLFGGYRLWHGFADQNTQDNDWAGDGLSFDIRTREAVTASDAESLWVRGVAVRIEDGWRLSLEDGTKTVLMDANAADSMISNIASTKLQFRETSVTVRALDEAVTYSAGVKWDAALLSRVSVGGTQRGWKLVLSTGTATSDRVFSDASGAVTVAVESGIIELIRPDQQQQFLAKDSALQTIAVAAIGKKLNIRRREQVVADWATGVATRTADGWAAVLSDSTQLSYRDTSARLSLRAKISAGLAEISSVPVADSDWSFYSVGDATALAKLCAVLLPRSHGGYLDDVWVYNKKQKRWRGYGKEETCQSDYVLDSDTWQQRQKKRCEIMWPPGRAGHTSVLDDEGGHQMLYIHGGYRTYFPYPLTSGAGAQAGIGSGSQGGFAPYPKNPAFLDDMWKLNLTSGKWSQIVPFSKVNPKPRLDHVMVRADKMFIMYGGYANNFYFGDTWYYNITSNHWLQKQEFVHALFPQNCTDDLLHRQTMTEPKSGRIVCDREKRRCYDPDTVCRGWWNQNTQQCQEKYMPDDPELKASEKSLSDPAPMTTYVHARYQEFYYVDGNHYGCCVEHGIRPPGTTENPDSKFNGVLQGSGAIPLNERATEPAWNPNGFSVIAEPTRKGGEVKILSAYANASVHIFQARRQAPGWDGCRDRSDGRSDLPNELLWVQPTQRAGHAAIWSPGKQSITRKVNDFLIIYGGYGYPGIEGEKTDRTPPAQTMDDMWQLRIHDCPKNCSLHGQCSYGSCFCDDGYYGVDCSNSSCPGDFCYYDAMNVQHCTHCCSATYEQGDNSSYLFNRRKTPCSLQHKGESHGVCDGFGMCMCAPPFIGDDCSMRDCQGNCSGHGDCSVEYPHSRCLCDTGWTGLTCEHRELMDTAAAAIVASSVLTDPLPPSHVPFVCRALCE
jgi:hypothetical protein